MKKALAIIFTVVILCSITIPAAAVESDNTIQPRWSYLDAVYAYLDINWLGVATCEGSAVAHSTVQVKTVVRLQQKLDSGWYTVETWSDTGTGAAGASGKIAVARGYDYRVTVSAYVYDDNGNIVETGSSSDSDSY